MGAGDYDVARWRSNGNSYVGCALMAKVTAEALVLMAEAAGYEAPRTIMRRQASGSIVIVLKHGPADDRGEIIFNRDVTEDNARNRLADERAN
jgi:hypothetical protein